MPIGFGGDVDQACFLDINTDLAPGHRVVKSTERARPPAQNAEVVRSTAEEVEFGAGMKSMECERPPA